MPFGRVMPRSTIFLTGLADQPDLPVTGIGEINVALVVHSEVV